MCLCVFEVASAFTFRLRFQGHQADSDPRLLDEQISVRGGASGLAEGRGDRSGNTAGLAPPPSDPALPPVPPTTSQPLGHHNLSSLAQNPAPKDPLAFLLVSLALSSEVVCYLP